MHPQENTQSTGDHRSGLSLPLFWGIAILVVYVLSPGPVYKLAGKKADALSRTVYAPLAFLADHVPAVEKFYNWYGHLWGLY